MFILCRPVGNGNIDKDGGRKPVVEDDVEKMEKDRYGRKTNTVQKTVDVRPNFRKN